MAPRQTYEPSCTVISMVPFPIDETKPGMTPSRFYVDPAPRDGFSTTLIQKCRHGVYLDEFRPTLIVPTAPEEVAEALCFDYKKGQLGLQMGEAEPGLFWVQGDFAAKEKHKELMATHAAEFKEAARLQEAWFKSLVSLADDAWSRFKQRGMISAMQKIAASHLKLEREWLLDIEVTAALSECPVCFEKVHPRAIVCRGCQAILNEAEYAKRKFAIQGSAQVATTK
jgi:hypothetical protein